MASERATRSASKWLTKRGGEFSDIDPLADLLDRFAEEAVREALQEAAWWLGTQVGASEAVRDVAPKFRAWIRARSEGEG